MHRLVRRFILNDMVCGSALWNDVFRLVLPAVYEAVKIELEKEGSSFDELPDVFESKHRELSVHTLALVHHYVVPARSSEIRDVAEVKRIYLYCGFVMQFMGKSEEGVKIWEQLLTILLDQQAGTPSTCSTDDLSEMSSHEIRRKELKICAACVCHSLGRARLASGKVKHSLEKHNQDLEMTGTFHRNYNSHSDIAVCLSNLGNAY